MIACETGTYCLGQYLEHEDGFLTRLVRSFSLRVM